MIIALFMLGALTLASAAGSVFLRNLVHAALCLAAALAGLAGIYLLLGAQFVGLAQVLVYVGAVAVIILFAVLLTRGSDPQPEKILSSGRGVGLTIALAVLVLFCWVYRSSELLDTLQAVATTVQPGPSLPVRSIGEQLMQRHALALQALGLLLTAALIGAVLLAMRDETANGASSRERGGTHL